MTTVETSAATERAHNGAAGARPARRAGRQPQLRQVRGIRVHVAQAGSGPALVLQHGYPQHWYAWHKIIPLLAEHFHVICPDMRGFGETDAPPTGYDKEDLAADLLAVCDALGVERFALAGHDWGGFVSFVAAVRAPQRVQRLVLLNSGHGFWKVDLRLLWALRGFWYFPAFGIPRLGERLAANDTFGRLALNWVHPGGAPWSPAEWETYVGAMRDPARAHATQQLYGRFVSRELARVDRRALQAHAPDRPDALPARHRRPLRQGRPAARLRAIRRRLSHRAPRRRRALRARERSRGDRRTDHAIPELQLEPARSLR